MRAKPPQFRKQAHMSKIRHDFHAHGATPALRMPSTPAAPVDTSTMRPRTNGPRSLTVTTTERELWRLVTLIFVPKGRLRWRRYRVADMAPLAPCGRGRRSRTPCRSTGLRRAGRQNQSEATTQTFSSTCSPEIWAGFPAGSSLLKGHAGRKGRKARLWPNFL